MYFRNNHPHYVHDPRIVSGLVGAGLGYLGGELIQGTGGYGYPGYVLDYGGGFGPGYGPGYGAGFDPGYGAGFGPGYGSGFGSGYGAGFGSPYGTGSDY